MGETDDPTQPGGGGVSEPVPREVYGALDLLERYFKQRVGDCGRAVDLVLALRTMASGTSPGSGVMPADAPRGLLAGGIDPGSCPGDPGMERGDDAAPGRGMLAP